MQKASPGHFYEHRERLFIFLLFHYATSSTDFLFLSSYRRITHLGTNS
ncbi:hypothetical protein FTV88_2494 [Heliorestis convoluta]|uniref:Uncharacterized protein n=1 Tax=Heliorestis convoluta TaxID=356322 RepID=A0A5Q2N1B2_9FIRM|nr:hypothetical protein FTV88_2494 [Heliorestis convoluta]